MNITKVGKNKWRLEVCVGKDKNGKRQRHTETMTGSKRDAQLRWLEVQKEQQVLAASANRQRWTRNHEAENEVAKNMLDKGYRISKKGWPDFWCIGQLGDIVLIEVKGTGDSLSAEQYQCLTYLAEHGLDVRIAWEGTPWWPDARPLDDFDKQIGHHLLEAK